MSDDPPATRSRANARPAGRHDDASDGVFDFASLVDLPSVPSADPPACPDRPRWYERESYLVPNLPALESISPDGRCFASVQDGEIVLRFAGENSHRRLTTGVGVDCGWEVDGQGRDPWAPDSSRLFALYFDRREVLRVPRVLFRSVNPSIDWPHQTKAGEPLGRAHPHVVALDGSPPLAIDAGAADCYFRLFSWATDGSIIWFGRYARDMSRVDVFAANSSTGISRLVLSESSETFLGDVSRVIWGGSTGFTLLADGGFLWRSERDGWSRLYRYNAAGTLIATITPPEMVVHDVIRVTSAPDFVYLTSSVEGPRRYDVHMFRVPLGGGECKPLTQGEGAHEVRFDNDGSTFVDTWSSPRQPPRVERRHADGRLEEFLGEANTERLAAGGWRPPEEFVVSASDGVTPLHGLLYYPRDFDANQQYPLIEMVYGGPQMTVTPRRFMPRVGSVEPLLFSLAYAGFLVMVLDARGTPGRSKAFQDAAYRDFAEHVIADHAAALRELLGQNRNIDADRIGVFGRSWGGYFALRFLLDEPGLYKAGVSIVPGFDVYGGMLYEPYLGIPQIDDSAYRAADLYTRASDLSRPFQMISGTLDTSTLGDAYRMSMVLTQAGADHCNVVFPEQDHQFTGRAAQQHDRMIRDFFRRHLGT